MAAGDIKLALPGTVAATITLASPALPSDSALLAGRQSAIYDNSTNKYLEGLAAARFTTGTSPTAGKIELWCFGALNDAGPIYPDNFGAADAAVSATSRAILMSGCVLVGSVDTDVTSNRTYPMRPVALETLFGGDLPTLFGFFVVHNTVAALNATGTNHGIWVSSRFRNVSP